MFKSLQVIRNIRPFMNDTGIVCAVDGHRYHIMFETANRGVEFRWYSINGLIDYRVIG